MRKIVKKIIDILVFADIKYKVKFVHILVSHDEYMVFFGVGGLSWKFLHTSLKNVCVKYACNHLLCGCSSVDHNYFIKQKHFIKTFKNF